MYFLYIISAYWLLVLPKWFNSLNRLFREQRANDYDLSRDAFLSSEITVLALCSDSSIFWALTIHTSDTKESAAILTSVGFLNSPSAV